MNYLRGSKKTLLYLLGQFSSKDSNAMEAEGSPETLENLVRVTQNQESIFQAYYTNDSGEVVTMSVYDISTTDPGPEYLFNISFLSLKNPSQERN